MRQFRQRYNNTNNALTGYYHSSRGPSISAFFAASNFATILKPRSVGLFSCSSVIWVCSNNTIDTERRRSRNHRLCPSARRSPKQDREERSRAGRCRGRIASATWARMIESSDLFVPECAVDSLARRIGKPEKPAGKSWEVMGFSEVRTSARKKS